MKPSTDKIQDDSNRNPTNSATPSQRRKPPKLRPPKLNRPSAPEDERSKQSEQHLERTGSESTQYLPNSVTQSQSQDSQSYDETSSIASESQSSPQPQQQPTIKRRTRRESVQPAEPDEKQFQVVEREQRSLSGPDMMQPIQSIETRNQEVAAPLRPRGAGQSQAMVPRTGGAQAGEMVETTETVVGAPSEDKGALKLRLDLNLDVEIELKAKIRGDLTLSLL
ncbi:hypothetical protein N7466_007348 [Penicillium verhagenii]|uniref:uncharacterized protein n=1 Tax=Penicillium verhagenii TaxID=1562060 RepID=UPI00254582B8|nr:uncharacterized protein N7466_007348 [Penicillium verhagenii]KAJ5928392.1 hypothetical protein N7466_007348 [Penicillium verhagenii]